MNSYDDRQKGFERKFAQDEETAFKITARRNKLLGIWAATKLGKSGDEAEQYAKEVVLSDFEAAGEDDVLGKVSGDFQKAGVGLTAHDIKTEMHKLMAVAREQIAGKKG